MAPRTCSKLLYTASIALICCVCMHTLHAAQMPEKVVPDAPVRQFVLPIFGEDGFKRFELAGSYARYLGDRTVQVLGLKMTTFTAPSAAANAEQTQAEAQPLDDFAAFAAENAVLPESTLSSPEAFFDLKVRRGEGLGTLKVDGPGFSLSGYGWTWYGLERRLTVNRNVEVEFTDGLGEFGAWVE